MRPASGDFRAGYVSGEPYQAVLHDYAERAAWLSVSALPTVIFNEKVSLVGAVPEERYRLMIKRILAGEPGRLIPIDCSAPEAGVAGQSVVDQSEYTSL